MTSGSDRRLRVLAALRAEADEDAWLHRLCELAVEATGTNGAGITVRSHDRPTGSVAGTDAIVRRLEALQYELGEGPSIEAVASGTPVLTTDLASSAGRWPAFASLAASTGASAVFSFPLAVDDVLIGVLDLYRTTPLGLTDDEQADARAIADIAARAVLFVQANAMPGGAAAALSPRHLDVVHQAAGMASIQLGAPVAAAMTRLRALAFLQGRPLPLVARDVVERKVRLGPNPARRPRRVFGNGQGGVAIP